MIPQPKPSTCPACGDEIISRWITGGSFRQIPVRVFCYHCGAALLVRRSYFSALYFVAMVGVALAAYAIGFGGYDFLVIVGFGVIPVWFLMAFVSLRLFPLELEETTASESDLRYFLADRGLSVEDGHIVASQADPEETPVPGGELGHIGHSGIFDGAVKVLLIAVYVFFISKGVIAVLDRFIPPADETLNAQEGFPLRAKLRPDTIAFTNMSDEHWKCQILLGSSAQVGAEVQLPPHQTREIAYADFYPSRFMIRSAQLRHAARQELLATCSEPSGRFRSGLLR